MGKRTNTDIVLIISALLVGMLAPPAAAAKIIYVDADAVGANDGSNWADAYKYLLDALADANSATKPVEVWVAEGSYKPDASSAYPDGTDNREATFQLISNVAIWGGFSSGGGTREDRDPNVYETILSGDLASNDFDVNHPSDLEDEPSRAENSYHVVTGSGMDATAILDGFSVIGGNAGGGFGGGYQKHCGGGMYNESGSPTLLNCTFCWNFAAGDGGAMHNYHSSPTLTNCTFRSNSTGPVGEGGGMYSYSYSSPTLLNCTFDGNSAGSGGAMCNYNLSCPKISNSTFTRNSGTAHSGAMFNNQHSSPTLTDCIFSNNSVLFGGGGMENSDASNPILINCSFSDNSARDGGGMANYHSSPNLTNCSFTSNSASSGGAIYNVGSISISGDAYRYSSSMTLTNCSFNGNTANRTGGTVHDSQTRLVLANCVFAANSAVSDGGGVYSFGSSATLANCSFARNSAIHGNALVCYAGHSSLPNAMKLTNCILWDGGNEISKDDDSTSLVTYSNVQGGWPGTGNIDADPMFLDAELRLSPGSPCIDAGDNRADIDASTPARLRLVGVDHDGNLRFVDDPDTPDTGNPLSADSIVDMGAYEFAGPNIPARIFVDAVAAGANNGTTWGDAFTDLQMALRTAAAGAGAITEIWVAAAKYTPDPNVLNDPRDATFQLVNNVAVYGGFPPGGTDWQNRDRNMHPTILSGDLNANDVQITDLGQLRTEASRLDNSYKVVTGIGTDRTAVLDGFTITAGQANNYWGGGIYNYYSSPTLANCTFTANYADQGGGMCNNVTSRPTLVDCTFSSNSAGWGGGGIYNRMYSSPNLTDCTLSGNSAGSGGGMYNEVGCSPTLTDCVLRENSGGAIENYKSSPALINCTFRGNSAGSGAGIYNLTSDSCPTLVNCIFSRNSASKGGGMYNHGLPYFPKSPTLINCIFSGNSAWDGGGINNDGSSPTLINCIFSGNSASRWHGDGGAMRNSGGGSPILTNCTFTGNSAYNDGGGIYNAHCSPSLTNCILWANSDEGGIDESAQIHTYTDSGKPVINYSCVQGWSGSLGGLGNIDTNPLFADAGHWNDNNTPADTEDDFWVDGDYHLRSQAGRWDPNPPSAGSWVQDAVTSPCIDAGDPDSPWQAELPPNGKRINMGAFGNTSQASMSPSTVGNIADLNSDGLVDFRDMTILTNQWSRQEILLPEDLDRNGIVDIKDYCIFADNWLWEQ